MGEKIRSEQGVGLYRLTPDGSLIVSLGIQGLQIFPGDGIRVFGNFFRWALSHNVTTDFLTSWSKINHPIAKALNCTLWQGILIR